MYVRLYTRKLRAAGVGSCPEAHITQERVLLYMYGLEPESPKLNRLDKKMTPFLLPPPLPTPFLNETTTQGNTGWGGVLGSLKKNKIASSQELSFLHARGGAGGGVGRREETP